jgi:hypothetical protein
MPRRWWGRPRLHPRRRQHTPPRTRVISEWVNYDCPFVKKHYGSGSMQKLQRAYTGKGVVWLSINSSAPGKQGYFAPDVIQSMFAERKAASTAYLIDSDGAVGRAYGAKTTPHMFVIDAGHAGLRGGSTIPSTTGRHRRANYVRHGRPLAGKRSRPHQHALRRSVKHRSNPAGPGEGPTGRVSCTLLPRRSRAGRILEARLTKEERREALPDETLGPRPHAGRRRGPDARAGLGLPAHRSERERPRQCLRRPGPA